MTSPSGTHDKPSAGDPLPPKCSVIEVHVGELKQLFNAIDPSPFRDKDLDPKAEEFIVGWAKDLPRDATLALVVDRDKSNSIHEADDLGRCGFEFLPECTASGCGFQNQHGIRRMGPGDLHTQRQPRPGIFSACRSRRLRLWQRMPTNRQRNQSLASPVQSHDTQLFGPRCQRADLSRLDAHRPRRHRFRLRRKRHANPPTRDVR